VIFGLTEDTVWYRAGVGFGGRDFSAGAFSNLTAMEMKLDIQKYERGVEWVRDLLWNT
jgi:hypothetical protein